MEETPKVTNYFVRTLMSAFCVLLLVMIIYRYFCTEPKGEITSGILSLLAILLVIVLAESFDNFSIGKLITISREKKKKEKEVEKLEKQNSQLLSQIITFSSTQNQSQVHTNVYGDYHAGHTVQKASEEEVRQENLSSDESRSMNEAADRMTGTTTTTTTPAPVQRPLTSPQKLQELGLNKYLQQRSISTLNVIKDAKLVTQFQGIDPISTFQPIFDGYLKESEHETFIEVRLASNTSMMFRDRLYVMLSKVNHYKTIKRIEAHLDLVLLKVPNEEARRVSMSSRMLETFEPAIATGLLKVIEIDLNEEEVSSCRE